MKEEANIKEILQVEIFSNHVVENKTQDWLGKGDFSWLWKALEEKKIKEVFYINDVNLTKDMVKEAIVNLETGYVLYPMWSEFNKVHS